MRSFVLVIAMVLSACQIQGRADEFRCDATSDCDDGRECVSGWCVVPGGGDGDAGGIDSGIDGEPCPSPCTTCDNNVCVVVCAAELSCPGTIVCPAGMECVVECDGIRSCGGGVNCTSATECTVNCDGSRACAGTVTCGTARCTVGCNADRTCTPGATFTIVDCGNACACDATCLGPQSCDGLFTCPNAGACSAGVGCSSTVDPACDTCP